MRLGSARFALGMVLLGAALSAGSIICCHTPYCLHASALRVPSCGQVGEVKNLGDKIREAVPGLSEVPSPGQAVQAGKDLVGKLPSAGDVQGARPCYHEPSMSPERNQMLYKMLGAFYAGSALCTGDRQTSSALLSFYNCLP